MIDKIFVIADAENRPSVIFRKYEKLAKTSNL